MTFLNAIKKSIPTRRQSSIAYGHLLRLTKERRITSKRELTRIMNEQIRGHRKMLHELAGAPTNNDKRRQIAKWIDTLEKAKVLAADHL